MELDRLKMNNLLERRTNETLGFLIENNTNNKLFCCIGQIVNIHCSTAMMHILILILTAICEIEQAASAILESEKGGRPCTWASVI